MGKQRPVKPPTTSAEVTRCPVRPLQRGAAAPHLASRAGAWAARRSGSSTGWPQPGRRWWQVLPLGPPDRYGSPYKSRSAFAAWPGLLARPAGPGQRRGADRRSASARRTGSSDWERIRRPRRGGRPGPLRPRMGRAARATRAERGVRLLGDVAIYVAPGSADHRAHPELFQDGLVAGAPPDAFSATGQLWGNPLYDWPALRRRRLSLVGGAAAAHARAVRRRAARPLPRLRRLLGGARGRSRRARAAAGAAGPAARCSTPSPRALGPGLPLGRRGPRRDHAAGGAAARRARAPRDAGAPVRLRSRRARQPAPAREPRRATASSTPARTTTTRPAGWYESLDAALRAAVDAELRARRRRCEREPWWGLIRLAFTSPARLAIVQAQDVLGLGSEARMNDPSRAGGNWRWQMPRALTPALAKRCARPRRLPGDEHPQ